MKKFLKYMLITTLSIIILIIGFLFLTDKGYELRVTVAEMLASSQHRHWTKYTFLPQEKINEIIYNIQNPNYKNEFDKEKIEQREKELEIVKEENNDLIVKIETIEKRYSSSYFYKGKVLEISNPKNVKLVSSSKPQHGEQIFVIAERVNAIAAINASGFEDTSGVGNGGVATGIVVEDGIIKYGKGKRYFVGSITNEGVFFTGKYKAEELLNMNVKYAAGFKPQLISEGEKMVEGDGGWGIGPRSAIGQKADGTIVMVIIDGRQPTRSMGATIEEVQNILYDRGVINAMAMDGGSSASMYFNGKNVTTPSSVGNVPRYLPNIWAVIANDGQKVEIYEDGELIKKED